MELLDEYCATPLKDVVRIICLNDTRILLVLEVDDPNWKLPGGKIEPNETVWEAIKREISEELGVDLADKSAVKKIIKARIPHSPDYRYIVKINLDLGAIKPTKEVAQTGMFELDKLPLTKFRHHIRSAAQMIS